MRTRSSRSVHEFVVYLLLLALVVPPVAPQPPADEPAPYDPPVFSFNGGRIDLMEAVRLTLLHDPALLLADEDTNLRAGVAQEFAGAFDWTLTGQIQYQHREQEISGGTRRSEQDKRSQLETVSEEIACPEVPRLELAIDQLQAARGAAPGVFPEVPSTDDDFEIQLSLLESLILANPNNPELQGELILERLAFIDAELVALRNALDGFDANGDGTLSDSERGVRFVCDEARRVRGLLGDVPEEEEFDQAQLQLRFEKLTRTGLFLAPFLTGNYNSTEFIGKESGEFVLDSFSPSGIPIEKLINGDRGGKNAPDGYTFELGFDVNMPLLRNRGRLAVAGPETAALIDYDASELTLEHTASESALNTAFAFWNLVAAQERVGVLETSVGLQGQVVDITRRLIEADELPAAESARGLAGEANAKAQLESANRDLIGAQLDLLRSMGLSVEGEQNVPGAEGGFPPPPTREEVERLIETELVRLGVQNRLDIQASRKLAESGGVLADSARVNLKPRLDLIGNISAIGRGEETLSDATDEWTAPSFRIGTSFEKPFGNNQLEGRLVQAEARSRQGQISAADLERLVRIDVLNTLGSLLEALDALAQAEIAGESFERTVTSEFEKLRLGESTLLDAVITEQQRTQALLGLVSARQQVANLVSQLRFDTGTLVGGGAGAEERLITWESLTTLPGTEAGS